MRSAGRTRKPDPGHDGEEADDTEEPGDDTLEFRLGDEFGSFECFVHLGRRSSL